MLLENAFPPITPVLRDRKFTFALVGAATLQIVLVSLNFPSWQCPLFHSTGIPCPGCGLTRAVMLLMRGEFREAMHFHAFAPFVVIAIVALVFAAVMPESLIKSVIARTELWERRTGFTTIIFAALILYWLARLLFVPEFAQLIQG
ncbi:MAG: DUF2752 domain-containing protein [bacterium]